MLLVCDDVLWLSAIRRHVQDESPDVKRRRRTTTDEPDDSKRSRYFTHQQLLSAFSALTLLVGQHEGHTACKNWVVGCWRDYLSGARCRLAYGPADATATHCLLLSKIQIGFIFLVLAHPGSPGQRAVKWLCVCVWLLCVMRHLAGQIVLRHRWHSAVLNIIISTAKLKMAYSCTWLKITKCVIFSHVTYQKRLCKCHPTMFYMRLYRCVLCDFMVLASDSHSKWNKVLSFGSLVIHAEKIRLVVDSSCIESALFSSISSVLLHCWLCLRRAGIQPLEYEHLHFWSYDLVACIEMLIVNCSKS